MSRYHSARGMFANSDEELLAAFGASELLPLVRAGVLRVIGGDPAEAWGELTLVIEGVGTYRYDTMRGKQYTLRVHRDEDIAEEAKREFGPGEGPNQKYNIEYEEDGEGPNEWVEGFDDADGAIAWIESELDSPREEWPGREEDEDEEGDGDTACPACGSGDAELTPEGLVACPDCDYIGRDRFAKRECPNRGGNKKTPGGEMSKYHGAARRLAGRSLWVCQVPSIGGYGIVALGDTEEEARSAAQERFDYWKQAAPQIEADTLDEAMDYFGGGCFTVETGKAYHDDFGE